MTQKDPLSVLHLVTTPRPFFNQQIDILENKDISCDVLSVPGKHTINSNSIESRSYLDYLRFYPSVLSSSFGSYDLIHANHGLTIPFALAQPKLPVVASLWGNEATGKYSWLIQRCMAYCDAVTVRNSGLKNILKQDVRVLPSGVNLDRFRPVEKRKAKQKVDWDISKKHVIFPYNPGRTVKNHPLAQDIVQKTNNRLADEVVLKSVYNVEHQQMPMYMNASDALLLTSKREGSPNSVKEAMACNTPVISTNVGDVESRLNGVEQSVVCENESELTDALVSVLRLDKESNGRDHVKDVSLERMGNQIIGIYKEVLNE